jgi:nicotinate-nucleotide adenylyltransferase
MNIALFGGSFDPFHIGHEMIVSKLLDSLLIDKLCIVPTYINPFKENYHLEPNVRYELLSFLYEKNEKIEIIDYEIKEKRKVPTIETIEYLASKYQLDTIYLVIGADNFNTISKWQNYTKLKQYVQFVVVTRSGYTITNTSDNCIKIELDIDVSSTQLRDELNLDLIPKKLQKRIQKLWKND